MSKIVKLPNGTHAIVPAGKLKEYCLNPLHPDGKHKAKVFAKALGIRQDNHTALTKLVLESAESGVVTRIQENEFGKIYRVEHTIQGIYQKEILCTLWIIHKDVDIPYLTSCFIKTKKVKK